MIEFPCTCGRYQFSVPQEMAGEMIQCPECHRLADVPTPGEFENLEEDGAYKLGPAVEPPEHPLQRLQSVSRAFTRERRDSSGRDIDLRPSLDDIMAAGEETDPIGLTDEVDLSKPQYDPLTGELIRPIDIKRDPNERPQTVAAPIPVASRALEYERGALLKPEALRKLALDLLTNPANLFVMMIVVIVHILIQPANLMVVGMRLLLGLPIFLAGVIFFLSHYANVVEDGGPGERDELPRPLRDASLYDDIWHPFVNFAATLIICFWPAFFADKFDAPVPVIGAVAMVGAFFFPAVLLTLVTSGALNNMRPDRVLGVIRTIGPTYIVLCSVMFAAIASYGLGLWRFQNDSKLLFLWQSQATRVRAAEPWWFKPWFMYPSLLAGIYLMHLSCWWLGSMYRLHHERFPWILQRHVRTPDAQRVKQQGTPQRNLNANSSKVKAAQSRAASPPR